ncbi:unnamed protein product [Haemonchus placei]|uniref:CSD domain-containing protein n=1 Tax=Haemonchus placei TaxID=6290 RepID=A0A0N4WE42_HAEPC|nr:unnamed protein product [Haemonchus placei]
MIAALLSSRNYSENGKPECVFSFGDFQCNVDGSVHFARVADEFGKLLSLIDLDGQFPGVSLKRHRAGKHRLRRHTQA